MYMYMKERERENACICIFENKFCNYVTTVKGVSLYFYIHFFI